MDIDLNEAFFVNEDFVLNEEVADTSDNCDDNVAPPALGLCYDNPQELADACHKYACQSGFQWHTCTCDFLLDFKRKGYVRKKGQEEMQYHMLKRLRLECVKVGTGKRYNKSEASGCKAYVEAQMINDQMTISKMELEHNHPMEPRNSWLLINYKYMTDYHKRRILTKDAAGVPVTKNFNSLVIESGGHENIPFTERDMRNVLAIERRRSRFHGDASAVEEYFKNMKDDNPNFFSAIQRDSAGVVLNVFWSDARCRATTREGDVVTFDMTHLTNRYRMPFAPFIGVNHHGSSVALVCGLISYEDADTFISLFNRLLECMGRAPDAILTDQCKAINKAIEIVFPSYRHKLCLFYILQNASRNLRQHTYWKEIQEHLQVVVHDSLSLEEFEEAWGAMVETFQLHDYSWIQDAYMDRRKWAPGFWRDSFWVGMSSTQRSEGMNFFFIGYLNMNSGLKLFVEQYHVALASRVEEEKKLNANSMEQPYTCNGTVLAEEIFHKAYTNAKFKELKDEWFKLSTCGIAKGNPGDASGGGVIRCGKGLVSKCYVYHMGSSNAHTVAIWGILYRLNIASTLGLSNLVIESNSAMACDLLNSIVQAPDPQYQVLKQCWRMIHGTGWEVRIQNVPNCENSTVGTLANYAFQLGSEYEEVFKVPRMFFKV